MKKTFQFKEGEVLLINKPLHWTSFQLVNKLRWLIKRKLGIKKIIPIIIKQRRSETTNQINSFNAASCLPR